jgi:lipoprotein NlpI
MKGQLDRAVADFDQAIELRPDYAEAFNDRGIVHSTKGNHGRAIEDYDEAIKLKPDYTDALNQPRLRL